MGIQNKKERDKIQKRLSQIYDDKLDGLINEKLYLKKGREYKKRQIEIAEEMKNHEPARAREIFESPEGEEKRELVKIWCFRT